MKGSFPARGDSWGRCREVYTHARVLCSLQELDDAHERDRFQSTVPAQLRVIWGALQAGDEAAAQASKANPCLLSQTCK